MAETWMMVRKETSKKGCTEICRETDTNGKRKNAMKSDQLFIQK
jgi:hypothetical protein